MIADNQKRGNITIKYIDIYHVINVFQFLTIKKKATTFS